MAFNLLYLFEHAKLHAQLSRAHQNPTKDIIQGRRKKYIYTRKVQNGMK